MSDYFSTFSIKKLVLTKDSFVSCTKAKSQGNGNYAQLQACGCVDLPQTSPIVVSPASEVIHIECFIPIMQADKVTIIAKWLTILLGIGHWHLMVFDQHVATASIIVIWLSTFSEPLWAIGDGKVKQALQTVEFFRLVWYFSQVRK